jgi:cytochrome c-type protein NapB
MHTMNRFVLSTVLALLPACFASAPPAQTAGLVEGKPSANVFTTEDAGLTDVVKPRAYELAPPVVPHRAAGYFITRKLNDCFDCHKNADEVEPGHVATKIPASHYENPFTEEKIADRYRVEGTRLVCTQCHVPQAAGEPKARAVRP